MPPVLDLLILDKEFLINSLVLSIKNKLFQIILNGVTFSQISLLHIPANSNPGSNPARKKRLASYNLSFYNPEATKDVA